MQRVTGLGGVFFKVTHWYEQNLVIMGGPEGGMFQWREMDDPEREGITAWAIFERQSTYFDPSDGAPRGQQAAMLNYRVENLDALLDALRAEGVTIDPKRDDSPYGRFAWIFDPEGNKIELWEPPK
jgi:predicted enzyme related to lactoylglutathione lyase